VVTQDRDPAVETDRVYTAATTQPIDSSGQPWGIDRIDQVNLPLSRTYTYNTTASNVTAYVIDTGIQTSHPQFGGRAQVAYDALGGNGQDCNGHGTHVAGTIGGSTYGVAKGVQLRAVRVLNCSGSGSTSGIINALNWLRTNHAPNSVANMSLGGAWLSGGTNTISGTSMATPHVTGVAASTRGRTATRRRRSSPAGSTRTPRRA
jgi:subtilisin family serine protease